MSGFPERAKVVIVGLGGIVGASVAHHLIERGWDDIVGIDKSGIPTDIGSTAHASDFCYATSHDFLSCWTTLYSIDFYEKMGHYARIGGIEVARVGDDVRMNEIRRKVDCGKAFGTRARLMEPAEIKEKFPLIEEELVQGGLWDPDAGPGHPPLADGRRQARRPGRGGRQAAGLRQHLGEVAGHRGRPDQGRRDHPRHDHGRPCGRLRRPLGAPDRRDGGRGPAGDAGRPSADLLRAVRRSSQAPASRSAGRCCATRATRPTCATPATRGPPRAARSSGATTRSTIRASCIRATCSRRSRPGCRRRSATSTWSRCSSRWSGRWS